MSAIVASKRLSASLKILSGTTKPVDGTSGTGRGQAAPGTLYIKTGSAPRLFINRGTKASPTWEPTTKLVTVVAAGRNAAGAITATGFQVGDKVVAATNLTDGTGDTANFESEITVADQIQQSSASNLTTKKYIFQVQR
jgi:hypothetical protein